MDIGEYFRFVVALVFVLALIATFALVARRAGFGFPTSASKSVAERRLSVIEVTPVDGRRRLVLVRRDNMEHLLLLGPTTETVIETGIPLSTSDRNSQAMMSVKQTAPSVLPNQSRSK